MTCIQLHIERWAAWAPGLETQDAWRQWLREPRAMLETAMPALSEMSAMMRRRIDPLGRVALQAAYWAQGDLPTGPVVFASRWGELARSVGMLQALAQGEALSPTVFSLSVHNAIGALYSIARKDKSNYQAVSAGEFSAEAGVAEAAGLLADGAEHVLLVFLDAPLPEVYASFDDPGPAGFPHAFACVLQRVERGGFSLSSGHGPVPECGDRAPGLAALQFLVGDATTLQRGPWTWTRHAA